MCRCASQLLLSVWFEWLEPLANVVVCVCLCERQSVAHQLTLPERWSFQFWCVPCTAVPDHWHWCPGFFSSGTEEKKQVENSAACRYKLQPEAAVASLSLLATDTSECHQVSPALPSGRATYSDVCSTLLPAAAPAPLLPLV